MIPLGRCCCCDCDWSGDEAFWCGVVDDMDRAPVAEAEFVVDGVDVCLFAWDAESAGGACCRKAARKDDRKKGRWEEGILAVGCGGCCGIVVESSIGMVGVGRVG